MDSPSPEALVSLDRATLQQLIVKLLQRKGMFAAEAEIVADRMIEADLRGRFEDGTGAVDDYLQAMDLGDIDPRARLITVAESPATAILDGSNGMGHVAATNAMLSAIAKATDVGTGLVVVRNSRPGGDLGGIAALAARQGLLGLATTSFAPEESGEQVLAWSQPASPRTPPAIHRELRETVTPTLRLLCQTLSAGLAGVDLHAKKSKPLRAANHIEFAVLAIQPATFAGSFPLAEATPSADAINPEDASSVPLPADTVDSLRQIAARIKFTL